MSKKLIQIQCDGFGTGRSASLNKDHLLSLARVMSPGTELRSASAMQICNILSEVPLDIMQIKPAEKLLKQYSIAYTIVPAASATATISTPATTLKIAATAASPSKTATVAAPTTASVATASTTSRAAKSVALPPASMYTQPLKNATAQLQRKEGKEGAETKEKSEHEAKRRRTAEPLMLAEPSMSTAPPTVAEVAKMQTQSTSTTKRVSPMPSRPYYQPELQESFFAAVERGEFEMVKKYLKQGIVNPKQVDARTGLAAIEIAVKFAKAPYNSTKQKQFRETVLELYRQYEIKSIVSSDVKEYLFPSQTAAGSSRTITTTAVPTRGKTAPYKTIDSDSSSESSSESLSESFLTQPSATWAQNDSKLFEKQKEPLSLPIEKLEPLEASPPRQLSSASPFHWLDEERRLTDQLLGAASPPPPSPPPSPPPPPPISSSLPKTIHDAARSGNVDATQSFIKSKVDIDAKNAKGESPLEIAAREGHLNVVDLLLKENVRNIHTAIKVAKNDAIRQLLFASLLQRINDYLKEIEAIFGNRNVMVAEMQSIWKAAKKEYPLSLNALQQKVVDFSNRYLNKKDIKKLDDEDWRCSNEVDLTQQYTSGTDLADTVDEIPNNKFVRLHNICWNIETLVRFIVHELGGENRNIADPQFYPQTMDRKEAPPIWNNQEEFDALLNHPSGAGQSLGAYEAKSTVITAAIAEKFLKRIGSILWSRGPDFEAELQKVATATELEEWNKVKLNMPDLNLPTTISKELKEKIENIKDVVGNDMEEQWSEMSDKQRNHLVALTGQTKRDFEQCLGGHACVMSFGRSMLRGYNLWAAKHGRALLVVPGLEKSTRLRIATERLTSNQQ